MLEDFKETQSVPYLILSNALNINKLSHAYLIDCNNYDRSYDFVLAFVKSIVCDGKKKCDECNLCKRIDDGNYLELKIIESDSNVIKKEQLMDLQSDFSLSGIENSKRIYVIKDCDKMNKQASNCLLKFLEEPSSDIIAILMTNNISVLLPTIVSRCQLIKLNNVNDSCYDSTLYNFASLFCKKRSEFDEFVNDDVKKKLLDDVINFIDYFEDNGIDTFIYLNKMWFSNFITRDDNIMALSLIVNFYYDVLRNKSDNDNRFFVEYSDLIKKVSENNSLESILNKISICCFKYGDLKYNVNINLLIDDMLVRLGECNEYS